MLKNKQEIRHQRKEELRRSLKQKLQRKAAKQNMMKSHTNKQGKEEFDLFLTIEEKKEPFNLRDLFENTEYKVFYEASIWEEYEDFVYFIQRNRHEKVLELAHREGIGSNEIIRPSGDTVMHVCAEFGREKLFEYFAKKGGDHNRRNYANETPFHVAAREGKITIVKFYMENYEVNVDVKMTDGWTPFLYSAFNGYTATMEYLVKQGADVNAVDRFNRSALHWAVRFENKDVVEKLLKLKVNYLLQDLEGNTAFDIARSKKYYEIA